MALSVLYIHTLTKKFSFTFTILKIMFIHIVSESFLLRIMGNYLVKDNCTFSNLGK